MYPNPPPELIETLRGTVNAWQCDYNHHLNIQFYCREFDQAARFLALSAGADAHGPLPPTRHLRFHAELVAGDIYRLASACIADGQHAGAIVHWMTHAGSGQLAATAIDGGPISFDCPKVSEASVAAALPRSLEGVPGAIALAGMARDGWQPTTRCWLAMEQCTAAGELTEQHLVAMFSDAAGHVWERAGAGVTWIRERGLGRIAVEARLSHFAPARAGEALLLHSRLGPARGKGIQLQHHLHRLTDGAPIARAEVTALLIDMATRKTVAFPFAQPAAPSGG